MGGMRTQRHEARRGASAARQRPFESATVRIARAANDADVERSIEAASHETPVPNEIESSLERFGYGAPVTGTSEAEAPHALLAGVFDGMSDAVFAADADGKVVLVNEAGRRAFGNRTRVSAPGTVAAGVYLPDQETPCPSEDLPLARALRGEVVRDVELFIRSPEQPAGRWYSVNATPLVDRDGRVCGAVAVGREVTDLRAARWGLQQLAQTDALTGTYNRRGFTQVARTALETAHQSGKRAAIFFIDLNGMKRINDSLGHLEGDRLLVDVAAILRGCFRPSDVVGRLGGDEFVVLTPEGGEDAEGLRAQLRAVIDSFNARSNRAYRISVSIGLGTADPGKRPGLEELVEQADKRMYEDKLLRRARRRVARGGPSP
jgi:diguanylate cyclase (GGDEF)-like protein